MEKLYYLFPQMMLDHVTGNGTALSDHGRPVGQVVMGTSVSGRPQLLHPGTDIGYRGNRRYSYAPGYISLGKVRDIVQSTLNVGISTKRPVKKVLHSDPES